MKEYVINVKTKDNGLDFLDGKWAVGFSFDKTASGKAVTFCVMRRGVYWPPYVGATFCNPHDTYDEAKGKREAFKRAIDMMLSEFGHVAVERKQAVTSRFRGALRSVLLKQTEE